MTIPLLKRIYLTDIDQNLTFAGILKSYKEIDDKIAAILSDVQVYEYSSSNPLSTLPEVVINNIKSNIHIEIQPVFENALLKWS